MAGMRGEEIGWKIRIVEESEKTIADVGSKRGDDGKH
jgi:hypothetical protein